MTDPDDNLGLMRWLFIAWLLAVAFALLLLRACVVR